MSGIKLRLGAAIAALATGGVLAAAASAAAPQSTAAPTITGTEKEGSTLTATTGTWSNNPTSFAYQWQRCASDGTGCGDITGAADKTYTPVSGDVGRTLRVVVTAINTDGRASATSDATGVVGSKGGPSNTVKPAVSGTAVVGEQLTVSNGSWSPTASSFARQWQRCDANGTGCVNIGGATGSTYGVRSADVDHRLRALVTAVTSGGRTTVASSQTNVATGNTSTVTTTQTTTIAGNRAPAISFLSLRRVGARAYARFRVCDDETGSIRVIERDSKARALAQTRRFNVALNSACATQSRSWIPARRFRGQGRFVVTLRAVDSEGRLSRLVSRSLYHR
jgi:hypothetical protein